jgi:hypothetical protein
VRVLAWFAVCAAFSSVPPFFRYAVIPVARKLWLPSLVSIPAAAARRPIQADRVKISAFQWRAAKLKPYGHKAEVALTGVNGGPVQSERVIVPVNDPIEAARVYQKVMGEG